MIQWKLRESWNERVPARAQGDVEEAAHGDGDEGERADDAGEEEVDPRDGPANRTPHARAPSWMTPCGDGRIGSPAPAASSRCAFASSDRTRAIRLVEVPGAEARGRHGREDAKADRPGAEVQRRASRTAESGLTASGRIGNCAPRARWKTPFLNGSISAPMFRCPSGATQTETPTAFAASAARRIASIATAVRRRSIRTFPVAVQSHPKSGIHSSCFLPMAMAPGGKTSPTTMTSRFDWWRTLTTEG